MFVDKVVSYFLRRRMQADHRRALRSLAMEATRLDEEVNEKPSMSAEERLRLLVRASRGLVLEEEDR